MSERDPFEEVYAEALREAAGEGHGQWRSVWTECFPTVRDMERERHPPLPPAGSPKGRRQIQKRAMRGRGL